MASVRWTFVGAVIGAAFWYLIAGLAGAILGLVLGSLIGFIADRRAGAR